MNHNTLVIEIKSTLDKLIAARTSLGYDYIVYGLLLINEDQTRVSNITKALYIDIAAHSEENVSSILCPVCNNKCQVLESMLSFVAKRLQPEPDCTHV